MSELVDELLDTLRSLNPANDDHRKWLAERCGIDLCGWHHVNPFHSTGYWQESPESRHEVAPYAWNPCKRRGLDADTWDVLCALCEKGLLWQVCVPFGGEDGTKHAAYVRVADMDNPQDVNTHLLDDHRDVAYWLCWCALLAAYTKLKKDPAGTARKTASAENLEPHP